MQLTQRRNKPYLSNKIESTFSDMSSTDHSDMVKRANESCEQRLLELAKWKKNRKQATQVTPVKIHKVSFYKRVKDLLVSSVSLIRKIANTAGIIYFQFISPTRKITQ